MPLDEEPLRPMERRYLDYVPAVFARTLDQAEVFCDLLNDQDVPAIVAADEASGQNGDDEDHVHTPGIPQGVPVLVPEALLEEASEIIADHEDMDEFQVNEEDDQKHLDDDDEVQADDVQADDFLDVDLEDEEEFD